MHSVSKECGASGQFSDEISDDHKDEVNGSADEGNFLFFSIDELLIFLGNHGFLILGIFFNFRVYEDI